MDKRNIPLAILFSIVTCGIYACYWVYKLTNEAHEAAHRQTTASGGMVLLFSLVTCGIYAIYWLYKMAETLNEAKEQRGMHVNSNAGIIYIVLAVFGLALVDYALIQDSLNDIVEFDNRNTNRLDTSSTDAQ